MNPDLLFYITLNDELIYIMWAITKIRIYLRINTYYNKTWSASRTHITIYCWLILSDLQEIWYTIQSSLTNTVCHKSESEIKMISFIDLYQS